MIAALTGTVGDLTPTSLVLDVGGVGFCLLVTPVTSARLQVGERAQLFTQLVVREDSLTLYGFSTASDRDAFRLVQTASGIGPKLALAILSLLDAPTLAQAVAASDLSALTRVPGVGKKVAERLIVELKDKVSLLQTLAVGEAATSSVAGGDLSRSQVVEGLVGLGYSARDAERAVAAVTGGDGGEGAAGAEAVPLSTAELMKAALKRLAR